MCITTNIFFEWLKKLDYYFARSPVRKILLFADNAYWQGNYLALPTLDNIRIEFLTLGITSLAQPLDTGIIDSVKKKFKSRQIHRML